MNLTLPYSIFDSLSARVKGVIDLIEPDEAHRTDFLAKRIFIWMNAAEFTLLMFVRFLV